MTKLAPSSATKTVKSKKVPKEVVQVPEPEPEVVEQPVVEETVDVVESDVAAVVEDTLRVRFDRLIKAKVDLISELKKEVLELKKMQKDHDAQLKDALKKTKKKRVVRDDGVPRKPSGFASPVSVSDELYGFLAQFGVKQGDLVARTDVTRYITAYIKKHDLQNPDFRREIVPDATLVALFGEPIEHRDAGDESSPKIYSYLRLQKYLSRHFPKKN